MNPYIEIYSILRDNYESVMIVPSIIVGVKTFYKEKDKEEKRVGTAISLLIISIFLHFFAACLNKTAIQDTLSVIIYFSEIFSHSIAISSGLIFFNIQTLFFIYKIFKSIARQFMNILNSLAFVSFIIVLSPYYPKVSNLLENYIIYIIAIGTGIMYFSLPLRLSMSINKKGRIITNIIEAAKTALEKMDKKYCMLSSIDYERLSIDEKAKQKLLENKFLERPFAYEFYHAFRKMIESGEVNFNGPLIQAEVDKRYQHCFKRGRIPDFIIHIPNTKNNLAVIEFKLASNLERVEDDFKKLIEFKQRLGYKHLIQVIIGDKFSLEKAKKHIDKICEERDGEKITIIEFDVEKWRATDRIVKYKLKI